MSALDYLLKKEWSAGNGQCPECWGVHAGWHGHPNYLTTENIGHCASCELAASIKDLGGTAILKGDVKSDDRYEHFLSPEGFYGTRLVVVPPASSPEVI